MHERPQPKLSQTDHGRRRESRLTPLQTVIIDEHHTGNVLSDTSRNLDVSPSFLSRMSAYSHEGFAHNEEGQRAIVAFLLNTLGIANRGPVLDVGFGRNTHIGSAFIQARVPAVGIDVFQANPNDPTFHAPSLVRTEPNGFLVFSGDIGEYNAPDSDLKEQRFGLILYNGSWASDGNNWTAADGEGIWFRYCAKNPDQEPDDKSKVYAEFVRDEKIEMLRASRDALTPNGLVGIISSRYAFHGSGWLFDSLLKEKLNFLNLYRSFLELGAKKIYVVGMSQKGFNEVLNRSLAMQEQVNAENPTQMPGILSRDEVENVAQKLQSITKLNPEDFVDSDDTDAPEIIRDGIAADLQTTRQVPELDRLARIDAIFAEF